VCIGRYVPAPICQDARCHIPGDRNPDKHGLPLITQNYRLVANRYFENVEQFEYLGSTVTNQNLIQEEITRRLSSGNACYHSVQNLFSSRLLSKNVKITIQKTVFLPVVLYGCETRSLALRNID
jgi:hypothetical protein